jgi:hypothetical protein
VNRNVGVPVGAGPTAISQTLAQPQPELRRRVDERARGDVTRSPQTRPDPAPQQSATSPIALSADRRKPRRKRRSWTVREVSPSGRYVASLAIPPLRAMGRSAARVPLSRAQEPPSSVRRSPTATPRPGACPRTWLREARAMALADPGSRPLLFVSQGRYAGRRFWWPESLRFTRRGRCAAGWWWWTRAVGGCAARRRVGG